VASAFVRARHAALGVEKVLPASALPYLAGWERIGETTPAEPKAAESEPAERVLSGSTSDEPAGEPDRAPRAKPVTSGSTPVGRPTRTPKES
jgi:hypothetical protein